MSEQQGKNVKRSAAYPAISLQVAVKDVDLLREKLGSGPYSRDSAAKALGYTGVTGTSGRRVASLVHYGLVERKGDTYYQSGLADQILRYTDDKERKQGIIRALKSPKLFQTLINVYEGKTIPVMLPHILSRQYDINETVSKEVVEVFKSSLDFAGVLINDVIVIPSDEEVTSRNEQNSPESESILSLNQELKPDPPSDLNSEYWPLRLPISGIVIRIPEFLQYFLVTNSQFIKSIEEIEKTASEIIKKMEGKNE